MNFSKHHLLFAAFAIAFCTQPASAEDYLLRLETVGYVDQPKDDTPKETSLGSIETIVPLNGKFHGRSINGPRTYGMTGELKPGDGHDVRVQIRCVDFAVNQETLLAANGKREAVVDEAAFFTSVALQLDKPLELAELLSSSSTTDPKGRVLFSSRRYVVTLKKYEPADKATK